MNQFYEELKEREGIDEDFNNVNKNSQIHRVEDVIRQMKPNCRAKNFKDYLKFEDNQNRNQQWRSI
jgi:accessory colonization factor AcfC